VTERSTYLASNLNAYGKHPTTKPNHNPRIPNARKFGCTISGFAEDSANKFSVAFKTLTICEKCLNL
jgi:hypothetical protein